MSRQGRTIAKSKSGKKPALIIVIILIAAIVLSAWYFTFQTQPSKSKQSAALDFTLVDLEGNSFSLSDYRGKVVVIDFMATWCGPCRVQVSHLGAIWEKYRDDVIIISIDIDPSETPEMIKDFSNQFPYATWIWAKDTANLGYEYEIVYIPTIVVVDQKGYVEARFGGVTPSSVLNEAIERLLG